MAVHGRMLACTVSEFSSGSHGLQPSLCRTGHWFLRMLSSQLFQQLGLSFSSVWLFSGHGALNVPIGICLHAYAIRSLDQWCSDLTSRNMALTLWVRVGVRLFGNTRKGLLMLSLPPKALMSDLTPLVSPQELAALLDSSSSGSSHGIPQGVEVSGGKSGLMQPCRPIQEQVRGSSNAAHLTVLLV